jgi:streptogramin lyase
LLFLLPAACPAACPLPTFTTQPQSQTLCSGGSVSFSVAAVSAGCTVSYQWYGPQGLISGATGSSYNINPVSAGNAGNYYAVASVIGSSRQSSTATLTVNVPPLIIIQPQSMVIGIGATVTFSVSATALPPPSYQWLFNGINLTDGGNIYGSATSTLTITNVQPPNGGMYNVVMSNTCGSATSANAILTVYPPYTFATLAGSTGAGSADGTGSGAGFYHPTGVAVDTNGNVYVADYANHTIRKITPMGVVTTLAGLAGSSGTNDGTGSAARFYFPAGMAVDTNGNVYVADQDNHTIRQVTPAGVVTTLAGSGGVSGTNDGTGSAARFNYPAGVAVGTSGNVYVADQYNDTIRQATPVGTNWVVTTLAGLAGSSGSADGTGSAARFARPAGVAVDTNGNVYVADYLNDTIRRVAPVGTNWVVTTLAGLAGSLGSADGTGSATRFARPAGVATDINGNIYVADQYNDTIRKVAPVGTNWMVTTLAGLAGIYGSTDGTGSAARFSNPSGTAVDANGNVYVADSANNTIRKGALSVGPPVILLQPQSQTVAAGSNVVFAVAATGTSPLGYQWLFNGIDISTATASAYTITNAQPIQAGDYFVLISNAVGMAASSDALLTVNTNVLLSSAGFTTNGFQFVLTGPVGIYVIQVATDLVNWLPLATNSTPTGLWDYADPSAIGVGRRFYRAQLQ